MGGRTYGRTHGRAAGPAGGRAGGRRTDRPTFVGEKCQSKTLFLMFLSTFVDNINVFDCRLSVVESLLVILILNIQNAKIRNGLFHYYIRLDHIQWRQSELDQHRLLESSMDCLASRSIQLYAFYMFNMFNKNATCEESMFIYLLSAK